MTNFEGKDSLYERVNNIKKNLKNKRVLIYGTGKFFQKIYKDYNLSELNIIGVIDKKYELNDSINKDFDYKVVRISEIYKQNADCILICLEKPLAVKKQLKHFFKSIKIYTLKDRNYFIQEIIKSIKIKLISKLIKIKNRKNFVLIKQDGTKIYNPKIKNLKINMWGENPRIEIYEPFNITEKCYISCGSNSYIKIEPFNEYQRAQIFIGENNTLKIGEYTTIDEANLYFSGAKYNRIKIGKDCMLSYGIIIRGNDGHTIYDCNSKEIKNFSKHVIIGDHVWIGENTIVLKNTEIPSNCIIGASSLVNKTFKEENCIIAGVPAKVVKSNINWDRREPHQFS